MICSHPYNTWPLHVKLFTEEAVKAWKDACAGLDKGTVPPGFTCVTELEGVDGKSGKAGLGRIAPIDTTDSTMLSQVIDSFDLPAASQANSRLVT